MSHPETYNYYRETYGVGEHLLHSGIGLCIHGYGLYFFDGSYKSYDYKYHRLDGPAIIDRYDNNLEWYINNCEVTDLIKKWANEKNIDLENLSDMDKFIIKLEWADFGK